MLGMPLLAALPLPSVLESVLLDPLRGIGSLSHRPWGGHPRQARVKNCTASAQEAIATALSIGIESVVVSP